MNGVPRQAAGQTVRPILEPASCDKPGAPFSPDFINAILAAGGKRQGNCASLAGSDKTSALFMVVKRWFPILMMCASAMAQNVNVTNLPIASGFTGSDTLLGITNGHMARYPASAFIPSTNGLATNLTATGTFSGDGSGITNALNPFLTLPTWLTSQTLPRQLHNDRRWVGYQAITDRIRTNCTSFTNRMALGSNTVDTTLISMMSNSAAGTCICLSNGVYNIGTNNPILTNGVMLLGQSMSNTILTWFTNSLVSAISMTNNSSLINLTVWAPSTAGDVFQNADLRTGANVTNVFLGNVICIARDDTIRFDAAAGSESQWFNVATYSHWDSAFPNQGSAASKCFMFNNYHFSDDLASLAATGFDGNVRALRTSTGSLTARWCTFEATNTARAVAFACAAVEIDGPGYGKFEECTFISNPGGSGFDPPMHIVSGQNTRQQVSGGSYDPAKFSAGKVVIFP